MATIADLPAANRIRCIGVSRDGIRLNTLAFSFDRRPTDDEMRFFKDVMDRAAAMVRAGKDG